MKCSLGISDLLEEISSLSHSTVCSISLHCSLKKAFLSLIAVLWNSAFKGVYLCFSPLPFASLLFSAICKASSNNHFAFLHFFFLWWSWSLPPVQCHEPLSILHQALYLLDLTPWIYLSLLLYHCKGFFRSYLNGLVVFPTFFNFSLNLAIRSSLSEGLVRPFYC